MVDSGVGKTTFGLKLNMEKILNGDAFQKFDLPDGFHMNAWSFVVNT